MKKFLGFITLTAALLLPLSLSAQTYVAQSGVSFFTSTSATATATSGAVQLPTANGVGILNITESGITGSPSGCTVKLAYRQNNATVSTAAVATISFTPATGTQQLAVSPSIPAGDSYVATYACSSAYPTAGLISASFSPLASAVPNVIGVSDPCANPSVPKSSAAISVATATTVQVIALTTGKVIYVCGIADGSAGTTPSLLLAYGTGTNCGTGTTSLTGAVPFTSGSALSIGWGGTITATPASNALCVTTVGTGHYGVISYVAQ